MFRIDRENARRIQEKLASRIRLEWEGEKVNLLAGADFGYDKKDKKIGAVIVIFKMPEIEVVERAVAVRQAPIPYIPGFLCFREGPVFFEAFRKIKNSPDVTLIDGNGIAHPRKMGLATYIGVSLDIPTIGCAKTPFFPFQPPSERRGAATVFRNRKGEKVGYCLRTRAGVKPVFVSPGHRIDFASSREVVLACAKFRIPEPIREAHKLAQELFA